MADSLRYGTLSAIQHRKRDMENQIHGAIQSFYEDTGLWPEVSIDKTCIGTMDNPEDYIVDVRSSVTLRD